MQIEFSSARFFSDRLVFDNNTILKVKNSLWNFLLSLIWLAPRDYTEENVKAIRCFKKYLTDRVGEDRLSRSCNEMSIDLNRMENKGLSLRSRHVIAILSSLKDVNCQDLQECIDGAKKDVPWLKWLDKNLLHKLKSVSTYAELDSETILQLYEAIQNPVKGKITYEIKLHRTTNLFASFSYDFLLLLNAKLQILQTNHLSSKEGFYERLCMDLANKDLEVGMIIRANNDKDRKPQFYKVKAKLLTQEGMLSYILVPLTKDSQNMPTIRVNKGTGFHPSSTDYLSFLITDFEKNLGRKAFDAGEKYEKFLKNNHLTPSVEMGYSLGGTLAQYRAAHHPEIETLYLFKSTGVPKAIMRKFNSTHLARTCNLFIRRTKGDLANAIGEVHLGWMAPVHVKINFLKFIPRKSNKTMPHFIRFTSRQNKCYGIEGSYDLRELNNTLRTNLEKYRYYIGGYLISPILLAIRKVFRSTIGKIGHMQKGLFIEDVQQGKWRIKHLIAKK